MPPLRISDGLDAEERRLPQHQVGELARLDRADDVRDAVRDRGVDRVLGDVALHARSCRAPPGRRGSWPRCTFILCAVCQVRMITSPTRPIACESDDIIENAPRSCRMSSAAIVSRADPRLGERDVLGDRRVEVVAHHQHVEVLVDRC